MAESKEDANKKVAELEKINAELNAQLAKAEKKAKAALPTFKSGGKEYQPLKQKFNINKANHDIIELVKNKAELDKVVASVLAVDGQTIFELVK